MTPKSSTLSHIGFHSTSTSAASLRTSTLVAVAVLLVSGASIRAADQSEAVAAITKLGGKVEVDEGGADKPVVKVNLSNKPIKDADLQHLKGLTKLQELRLGGTKITDRGLEHLKDLTDLRTLNLDRTEITDGGLKHLAPLTNLRSLNVCETPVTDAGVKHLKKLTKLEYIDLSVRGDIISDAAGAGPQEGIAQSQDRPLTARFDFRSHMRASCRIG